MKNLSSLLLEKLSINKDTKMELSKEQIDDLNKQRKEDALEDIKKFLSKYVGAEKNDYEIREDSNREFRIYIYEGGKDFFKELEDKWYNDGYAKKEWFFEIHVTNYGLRVRPSYWIHWSDFRNVKFRR